MFIDDRSDYVREDLVGALLTRGASTEVQYQPGGIGFWKMER